MESVECDWDCTFSNWLTINFTVWYVSSMQCSFPWNGMLVNFNPTCPFYRLKILEQCLILRKPASQSRSLFKGANSANSQFSEISFFGFHTCNPGPSSRYHLKFVVYKQALSSWYTLKQTNHNPQWSKGAQFHSEIKTKIWRLTFLEKELPTRIDLLVCKICSCSILEIFCSFICDILQHYLP